MPPPHKDSDMNPKDPTITSDNEQDTDTDRPIRDILDELDQD